MDEERFDRLTLGLSRAHSRRSTLTGLIAGLLGLRTLAADARPKRRKDTRHNRKHGKARRDRGNEDRASAQAKQCRGQGHPCEGNQSCCAPFVCVVSGPGAAKRCTPCPSGTVFFNGACCTPTTCAAAGAECGTLDDTCGGTLDCGQCSGHDTCGGGGEPHVCGCTPQPDPAICAGKCGLVTNNCGQEINCTPLCSDCCAGDICWPRCNGVCVDRLSDHDHCGDCGVTCGNLTCYHGNCCTTEPDPDFPDLPDICVCAEEGWACDGTAGTCCQHGECTNGVCPGPENRQHDRGQARLRRH